MFDLILLVFIGFVSGLNYVAIQRNYTELNKLKHYLDIIRQDIEKLNTRIIEMDQGLLAAIIGNADFYENYLNKITDKSVFAVDNLSEKIVDARNMTYRVAYIVNKLNPEFWDCNCQKKLKDKMKCESSIDKDLKQDDL